MKVAGWSAAAVLVGLTTAPLAANATIVTGTYSVVGSNFLSKGTPPYASITESFTITFDNSATVFQQTANIVLNQSTITPTSTLAYNYIKQNDSLTVGGIASTVTTADPNSFDFALVITGVTNPGAFTVTALSYSTGTGESFTATTYGTPVATPEPASLALLAGMGAMAGLMRRGRRV